MTTKQQEGYEWALDKMRAGNSIDYIRGALSMHPNDHEFTTGGRRAIIETLNGDHPYPRDPDEAWFWRHLNLITITVTFYVIVTILIWSLY